MMKGVEEIIPRGYVGNVVAHSAVLTLSLLLLPSLAL
jgi:hypothetical protein